MPSEPDDGEYHVSHFGLHYGPFQLTQLLERALTSDMLVWRPGMPDWRPIESVAELAPFVRRVSATALSAPPPLPVAFVPEPPILPPLPLPARTATATTFAVLNVACGMLGIFCGVPAGLAVVAMPPVDPFVAIMGNPVVTFVRFFGIGIGFVASVMLVASGVGLWRQRGWGGRLAVNYAVLSIVANLVVTGLLGVMAVAPMFVVARQHNTPEAWEGAVAGLGGFGGGACGGIIYPIVVLAAMRLDSVKRCLA